MNFATSNHGTLTFVEALNDKARGFLASLGFSSRVALSRSDFREVCYAASAIGLAIERAR